MELENKTSRWKSGVGLSGRISAKPGKHERVPHLLSAKCKSRQRAADGRPVFCGLGLLWWRTLAGQSATTLPPTGFLILALHLLPSLKFKQQRICPWSLIWEKPAKALFKLGERMSLRASSWDKPTWSIEAEPSPLASD